ncbi:hypothetical protein BKA70DRAFT_1244216, partial [Coprinopsis sp. MPI-PUGE-AT-0042]
MADKENVQLTPRRQRYGVAQQRCGGGGCCPPPKLNALELGPRKRGSPTDPLVHHGRHFGRSIYAFVNIYALIINGLAAEQADEDDIPDEPQARREVRVYQKLLKMVPSLHERLVEASEEEVMAVSAM